MHMASTVHESAVQEIEGGPRPPNGSGNGGWPPAGSVNSNLRTAQEYAPAPASTGIWVALAAISMSFAALTSALVVRKGGASDWQHFQLPSILYLNTALLIASSTTLEIARRRIAAFMSMKVTVQHPARWLYVTLSLGMLFVIGQYIAWQQLSAQGLYLASNPSSSFFYVLTAAHGLHVIGGLAGLVRVIRKLNGFVLRRSTLVATSRYWHFMDVLWIYLMLLLWMKL
jgi:cytochrome c oxidase subunit III